MDEYRPEAAEHTEENFYKISVNPFQIQQIRGHKKGGKYMPP
jgi:hypothetical protein